jgi:hypothetical protein
MDIGDVLIGQHSEGARALQALQILELDTELRKVAVPPGK